MLLCLAKVFHPPHILDNLPAQLSHFWTWVIYGDTTYARETKGNLKCFFVNHDLSYIRSNKILCSVCKRYCLEARDLDSQGCKEQTAVTQFQTCWELGMRQFSLGSSRTGQKETERGCGIERWQTLWQAWRISTTEVLRTRTWASPYLHQVPLQHITNIRVCMPVMWLLVPLDDLMKSCSHSIYHLT